MKKIFFVVGFLCTGEAIADPAVLTVQMANTQVKIAQLEKDLMKVQNIVHILKKQLLEAHKREKKLHKILNKFMNTQRDNAVDTAGSLEDFAKKVQELHPEDEYPSEGH